mmetsp:Transcript_30687/g.64051  ORF Transcript_30687/g.64051 Transcript_30687/m.64051 type:complete len:97 (+) Transcript_30687:1350-1640(+)
MTRLIRLKTKVCHLVLFWFIDRRNISINYSNYYAMSTNSSVMSFPRRSDLMIPSQNFFACFVDSLLIQNHFHFFLVSKHNANRMEETKNFQYMVFR